MPLFLNSSSYRERTTRGQNGLARPEFDRALVVCSLPVLHTGRHAGRRRHLIRMLASEMPRALAVEMGKGRMGTCIDERLWRKSREDLWPSLAFTSKPDLVEMDGARSCRVISYARN